MIVACYHPLPWSACMLHFDLVSILFGTSIPTSFNILVKMFLHFIIINSSQLHERRAPPLLTCCLCLCLPMYLLLWDYACNYFYMPFIPCLAPYGILPSSCLAAYILPPSSPVLRHLYCICFSTFWHCHPYIHFNVLTPFIK